MIFFLKMIVQTFSALSHAGFKIDLTSQVSRAQPQVLFYLFPFTEGEERRCRRWKQWCGRLCSRHQQQRCRCCDIRRRRISIQQHHGFLTDILDFRRSRGSPGGRAQRPGGAGAVCPHLQTTTHQAGIHPGKRENQEED